MFLHILPPANPLPPIYNLYIAAGFCMVAMGLFYWGFIAHQ